MRLEKLHQLAKPGRIALTANMSPIYWPIRLGQAVVGSPGIYTHCGIIGEDGFYWNMRGSGLSYTYLGNEIRNGGLVSIFDLGSVEGKVSGYTISRGIKRIKELHRWDVKYDWVGLFTGGRLSLPGRHVCSQLVRAYLVSTLDTVSHCPYLYTDPFFTPNELRRILSHIGSINDDLRPWRNSKWIKHLRQPLSQELP